MTKVMKDTPPIKESISQETSCSPLSLQLSTSNDKDSLLFLDEVFTKKKDDYLGFIKSREKLPLILSEYFPATSCSSVGNANVLLSRILNEVLHIRYKNPFVSSVPIIGKSTDEFFLANLYSSS